MFPIVIVDDAREDLLLAAHVLRQGKILNPIHLLNSAGECIDLFSKRSAQPGLVLLDLVMYPENGLDLMRALSGVETFRNSVVVMLTGLADIRMIHESYQLGATTFLIKPFEIGDLMQFLFHFNDRIQIEAGAGGKSLVWPNEKRTTKRERENRFHRMTAPGDGNHTD